MAGDSADHGISGFGCMSDGADVDVWTGWEAFGENVATYFFAHICTLANQTGRKCGRKASLYLNIVSPGLNPILPQIHLRICRKANTVWFLGALSPQAARNAVNNLGSIWLLSAPETILKPFNGEIYCYVDLPEFSISLPSRKLIEDRKHSRETVRGQVHLRSSGAGAGEQQNVCRGGRSLFNQIPSGQPSEKRRRQLLAQGTGKTFPLLWPARHPSLACEGSPATQSMSGDHSPRADGVLWRNR
ncbi:hypothetical protein C8F01DRAFT_1229652 [Mycena amicta]|nr:hypothetical protein C8F01DRAFT_1229652 [Mycena amicta]